MHIYCFSASVLSYCLILRQSARTFIHSLIHSLFKITCIKPYSCQCFAKFWNSGSKFYLHIRFYWGPFKKMPAPGLGNRRFDAVSGGGTWAVYFQKAFPGMASVENHCSRVVVFQSMFPSICSISIKWEPITKQILGPHPAS